MDAFPEVKEIFFDDDTFNYRKARTLELCAKLKPLNFTWSCTSRVTTDYETLKAMKESGCRLLIVGHESGDPQILKNIKKGRPSRWRCGSLRIAKSPGRYSFFMDSHFLLVRTVATLARRQIALEALLQGKGISKENIAEAAGQVPIPQIIPTHFPIASHYQEELEEILKALGQ